MLGLLQLPFVFPIVMLLLGGDFYEHTLQHGAAETTVAHKKKSHDIITEAGKLLFSGNFMSYFLGIFVANYLHVPEITINLHRVTFISLIFSYCCHDIYLCS